jgi:ribonuclease HI
MNDLAPHYLLTTEANRDGILGKWRFVLKGEDDSPCFEAEDVEPDIWGERLDLLTVVRALESLDQPSRVTLVSCSRYVLEGIQYGLAEWRENGWQWEAFGQMVPIRDADLWQRIDRVLQFHQIECGQRRVDGEHPVLAGPHWNLVKHAAQFADRVNADSWVKCTAPLLAAWSALWVSILAKCWHQMSVVGSSLMLHRL